MLPTPTLPQIPRHVPPHPTKEALAFAELTVIDISKAKTAEGKTELVLQIREALANVGFFYVVNHGYTVAQIARIFDIANASFTQVSPEEQLPYLQKDKAVYTGYKARKEWVIGGGIFDEIEQYSVNYKVYDQAHPVALRPLLPELAAFSRHNHFNVLQPILRILALGLELPEDALTKLHDWNGPGESSARFIKYHPRDESEEIQAKHVWLNGHTDISSISLLYSQPVAGLQILARDGKWKYIKHLDNALVVNAGDALQFLSGGLYRATIHRVVQPPDDQKGVERLGVFYFAYPNDDVKLNPLADSPVLQRIGTEKRFADGQAPMMREWRRNRTSSYGHNVELKDSATEKGVKEEVIQGTVVKHWVEGR
ncbi:hypothetical protein ONZ45_g1321 [Pleurotus djamor]|nr:hypothetical protein ONZ45_g1321 [Pleurotus djamor]